MAILKVSLGCCAFGKMWMGGGYFGLYNVSYDAGRFGSAATAEFSATSAEGTTSLHMAVEVPRPMTILHNTSSPHAAASFLGEVTAATWEEMHAEAEAEAGAEAPSYAVYNQPLPLTAQQGIRVRPS